MTKADFTAEAQKLGIQLTGDETVAQIQELIKQASPESDADKAEQPATVFTRTLSEEDLQKNLFLKRVNVSIGDVINLEVGKFEIVRKPKTVFEVLNSDGGVARTYTLADHGENAEELAKQFAAKIGGIVK